MRILLVRHAIAVARSEPSLDHARPLTPRGRARFETSVQGLASLGVRLGAILHSPWTRAVQTADLLSPLLDGPRVVSEGLAQEPAAPLLEEVRALAPADEDASLALVGHQPWVGALAAWLVWGDARLGGVIEVKKGSVMDLRGDPTPGGCVLAAHLPPRALRRCAARLK